MSLAVTLDAGTALFHLPRDFDLQAGGRLHGAQLAYELTGPEAAPLVVVLGGISAGRHVARTALDPAPGWWDGLVGPDCALDTGAVRVLGIDYLGGCGASTGPGCGEPPFPALGSADQARALELLLDHLDEFEPVTVIGASYGGMVGLALAAQSPHRVHHLVAVSAADRSHPLATAWRVVQRGLLERGLATGDERACVQLARALAMTTYRTPEELAARFDLPPRWVGDRPRFAVEDYLAARGDAFAACFDARAYLALSLAIDLHNVDPARITAPTTLVAVDSDRLVPAAQIRALAPRLGGPVEVVELASRFGHDAFLKETAALVPVLRRAARGGRGAQEVQR